MRDPVALLLADHDVAGQVRAVGVVGQHLVQQVRAADRVLRRFLEEVEEHAVLGGEDVRKACHDAGERTVKAVSTEGVPAAWAGTSSRSDRAYATRSV